MNPDDPNAETVGSFRWPVPVPLTDPDSTPLVGVCFNIDWLPYIVGALKQLLLQPTWATNDPATLALAQQRATNLIMQFNEECPQMFAPGILAFYATPVPPVGWLDCDGGAVSRTAYADLFAAIGTMYGPGDGSTTFNVPDLRGRSPVGAGTGSGLSPRSIGAVGGEETHQLTVSELASHSHSVQEFPLTGTSVPPPFDAADALPHVVNSTGATGGDVPHNTMHPFLVVGCMIKT